MIIMSFSIFLISILGKYNGHVIQSDTYHSVHSKVFLITFQRIN